MASKRYIGRQAVETWIEGYLKLVTSGARLREERKFIEKSIVLINRIFGHPCCDDETAVVSLITPNDNQLTHTIIQLLQKDKITRRLFRQSLFRILNLLNKTLYDCCTETVTISYGGGLESNTTLSFTDIVTGEVVIQTQLGSVTPLVFTVPSKYFGPAALIKVCITNVNVGAGVVTTVDDQTNLIPSIVTNPATNGQACSETLAPLSTAYEVRNINA